MKEMSEIHKKIDDMIDDICKMAKSLSRLIIINPSAAKDGLQMIETNVKIMSGLFNGLLRKK